MAGICSLFQVFPEVICSCFFIISHGKDLKIFKSSIWKRKKKSEVTKTSEQSGLEPETIRWRIFGLFASAICELTNAGGKKSMKSFRWPPLTTCTSNALASVRYAQTQSLRFVLFEWRNSGERANLPGIRLLFPSALGNKVYLCRMRRLSYENKMHPKSSKQVTEAAAISGCTKSPCVQKVGDPHHTIILMWTKYSGFTVAHMREVMMVWLPMHCGSGSIKELLFATAVLGADMQTTT